MAGTQPRIYCRSLFKQLGTNYLVLAVWKVAQGLCCIHFCLFFFVRIIICRLYELTLSDQAQVTLQLRVISVKNLSQSARTGGPESTFGSPGEHYALLSTFSLYAFVFLPQSGRQNSCP